jgi:hypothetical protein
LKAMKCFDEFCDETNLNKLNLPGFVMWHNYGERGIELKWYY